MYCPSCDKSYGAVHSRCPECHSWLKVSAPASSRAKSAKSGSSVSMGSVSTLDKEPAADNGGGLDWAKGGSDSWADALPTPPVAPSPAPSFASDPPPVSDAWAGASAAPSAGSGWGGGGSSSDSWGGGESAKMPSAPPSPPAPSGGWLGGAAAAGGDDDGWGASSSGTFKAPPAAAPATNGVAKSLADPASDDGWGSSSGLSAAAPAAPNKGPSIGFSASDDGDGWGGAGSASTFGGAAKAKAPASTPPSTSTSQGWLGGDESGTADEESAAGWLGGASGPTAKMNAPTQSDSDGWLSSGGGGPSMTEMVDRAINVEEADDFVDDSWVDEEVGNGEFDDLEVPEYVPPAPEVGGAFLKMLLVAVLVLVVGGGMMFMGQEKKTPEQIKAQEIAKELEFGRSSVKTGKTYLKDGKALLAIGPLEAAMTSLKTAGGTEEEILEAKVTLARALMKAQEYQKSYDHWSALAKGNSKYKKEGKTQLLECSKLLRAQAADQLAEAAGYIKAGEQASVLDLGQKALKIYEAHKGTASQKGKAWGVIGRGYANGKEYGKAKDALRKARSLNPSGGYEADLARIAEAAAPSSYYYNYGAGSAAAAAPAQPTTVYVPASINSGDPAIPQGVRTGGGGSYSAPAAAAPAAPAPAAPQQTRAIPAYQRSTPRSSGQRLGTKGQLQTY